MWSQSSNQKEWHQSSRAASNKSSWSEWKDHRSEESDLGSEVKGLRDELQGLKKQFAEETKSALFLREQVNELEAQINGLKAGTMLSIYEGPRDLAGAGSHTFKLYTPDAESVLACTKKTGAGTRRHGIPNIIKYFDGDPFSLKPPLTSSVNWHHLQAMEAKDLLPACLLQGDSRWIDNANNLSFTDDWVVVREGSKRNSIFYVVCIRCKMTVIMHSESNVVADQLLLTEFLDIQQV